MEGDTLSANGRASVTCDLRSVTCSPGWGRRGLGSGSQGASKQHSRSPTTRRVGSKRRKELGIKSTLEGFTFTAGRSSGDDHREEGRNERRKKKSRSETRGSGRGSLREEQGRHAAESDRVESSRIESRRMESRPSPSPSTSFSSSSSLLLEIDPRQLNSSQS